MYSISFIPSSVHLISESRRARKVQLSLYQGSYTFECIWALNEPVLYSPTFSEVELWKKHERGTGIEVGMYCCYSFFFQFFFAFFFSVNILFRYSKFLYCGILYYIDCLYIYILLKKGCRTYVSEKNEQWIKTIIMFLLSVFSVKTHLSVLTPASYLAFFVLIMTWKSTQLRYFEDRWVQGQNQ